MLTESRPGPFTRDAAPLDGPEAATGVKAWVRRRVARTMMPPTGDDLRLLLTFDDGPHPVGTPRVLEQLARFDARGIFFVVGSRIDRAPDLLKEIRRQGHLIGNHTFEHPEEPTGLLATARDIQRCQELVERLTGERPRVYRPALGRVSVASMGAPRLFGLDPILWSINGRDWTLGSTEEADACAARIVQRLADDPGNHILLLHDENPFAGHVLAHVLRDARRFGYDFSSAVLETFTT